MVPLMVTDLVRSNIAYEWCAVAGPAAATRPMTAHSTARIEDFTFFPMSITRPPAHIRILIAFDERYFRSRASAGTLDPHVTRLGLPVFLREGMAGHEAF